MNALLNQLEGQLETIKSWRHHLHRHPELSLDESKTAKYIVELVRSWGYDVVEGVGKYGVVASLSAGNGTKSIGLRADTVGPSRRIAQRQPGARQQRGSDRLGAPHAQGD